MRIQFNQGNLFRRARNRKRAISFFGFGIILIFFGIYSAFQGGIGDLGISLLGFLLCFYSVHLWKKA